MAFPFGQLSHFPVIISEEDLPPAAVTLPLPSDALRFQTRVKHGTIDVWWLYDDGGLTLLIPYLLTKEKSYLEGAKLRVFTLAGQGKNLQQEQQGLVTMLKKFRITADQVNVIPDFTSKKPDAKRLARASPEWSHSNVAACPNLSS